MWLHTINRDKMGDIRNGWTAGVYPLDLNQGFKKDRVGVIEERNQFFWIVEQAATEAKKNVDNPQKPRPLEFVPRPFLYLKSGAGGRA